MLRLLVKRDSFYFLRKALKAACRKRGAMASARSPHAHVSSPCARCLTCGTALCVSSRRRLCGPFQHAPTHLAASVTGVHTITSFDTSPLTLLATPLGAGRETTRKTDDDFVCSDSPDDDNAPIGNTEAPAVAGGAQHVLPCFFCSFSPTKQPQTSQSRWHASWRSRIDRKWPSGHAQVRISRSRCFFRQDSKTSTKRERATAPAKCATAR